MSMFIVSPIAASCAVVIGAVVGLRGPLCSAIVAIGAAIVVAFIR
ncbi:hypothetical protein [Methylobacterium sp. D54C]